MSHQEVHVQFTVVRVEAFVDGTKVIATKDRNGRLSFQWERSVGEATRATVQRRMAVALNRFDVALQDGPSNLPLFVGRDPA